MMIFGMDLPDSPVAKFGAWVATIAGGTLAAWLWLDGYFLHRAEGAEMKAEFTAQVATLTQAQQAQLSTLQMQIEYSADQNAKRAIDTELFKLEQVPPQQLRPQDRALYQQLIRQRGELVDLWNKRGRPLR
jgi:hypothetical protein